MKMRMNFEVEVKAEDLTEKNIIVAVLKEAGLQIKETPIDIEVESENQKNLDEINRDLASMRD